MGYTFEWALPVYKRLCPTAVGPSSWGEWRGVTERAKGGSQGVILQVSEKRSSNSVGKYVLTHWFALTSPYLLARAQVQPSTDECKQWWCLFLPCLPRGIVLLPASGGTWRNRIISFCKILGLLSRLAGQSIRLESARWQEELNQAV